MLKKKYKFVPCYRCDSCVLDGPSWCAYLIEVEVVAAPRKRAKSDDAAWRREIAMQAGMGLGVGAFNDA